MNRLNPVTTGLSLAITIGLLYLLCALIVAVAPGPSMALLGMMAHGLNIAPLTQQVPPMTLAGLLISLLFIMAYSFLAGLLFCWTSNALTRKQG